MLNSALRGRVSLLAIILCCFAAARIAAGVGAAHRVKDIRRVATPFVSALGIGSTLGDELYFVVDDGTTGQILWKTDGQRRGTGPVMDVVGGPPPLNPNFLRPAAGRLYFSVGDQLWVSGGPDGTRRLGGVVAFPDPLGAPWNEFDGRVYFAGAERNFSSPNGYELWATDGTPAGTGLVADLMPGPTSSNPYGFTVIGGALWFFAGVGDNRYGLYRLDAGSKPVLIHEFAAERGLAGGVPYPVAPSGLTDVGGWAYFSASDGGSGAEPWRSDGTTAGTIRLRDIAPGPSSSFPSGSGIPLNNRFLFVATDASRIQALWASDRSTGETSSIGTFLPAGNGKLYGLATLGYVGLFWTTQESVEHAVLGVTLWSTDGTPEGTRSLRSFSGQPIPSIWGSKAFFIGSENGGVPQLWQSDGTLAGTRVIAGDLPSAAKLLAVSPHEVFLSGFDGYSETSLWAVDLDGDPSPREVIAFRFPGSKPTGLSAVGSRVLFGAFEDGAGFYSLWSSDGTDQGTARLLPGAAPNSIAGFGDRGFLFGDDGTGLGPFVTDGTPSGTRRLARIEGRSQFVALGSAVYFLGYTAASGPLLWRTDGTEGGTRPVVTDVFGASPLVTTGARLFFHGGSLAIPDALWSSDGTAEGTLPLVFDGSISLETAFLFAWNGRVYFQAGGVDEGHEPWVSDGTTAGTYRLAETTPGPSGCFPCQYTGFRDQVYFWTQDPAALWKTDGTVAGTVVVREISVNEIAVSGDTLFFVGSDTEHGTELWKTDGTREGTVMVRDIAPGTESGTPRGLPDVGGILLFSANDAVHGYEPWRSDGTEAGTFLLQDINPGLRSSNPSEFTRAGDQIFFSADDGDSGYELWVMPASSLDGSVRPVRPRPRDLSFR